MSSRPDAQAKKGRPTPKRAAANDRVAEPSSVQRDPEPGTGVADRVWQVSLAVVVAFAHVFATLYLTAATGGDSSTLLASLALAAAATAVFVPSALRRGWHRWLVLWGLTLVVQPDALLPTLIVAEAWVLHRFWCVEGPPRLPGR